MVGAFGVWEFKFGGKKSKRKEERKKKRERKETYQDTVMLKILIIFTFNELRKRKNYNNNSVNFLLETNHV